MEELAVKTSQLFIYSLLGMLALSGCGSEQMTNERQQTLSGFDARPAAEVYLAFQLPDRASFSDDGPALSSQIDSYYFRYAGQGPRCPSVTEQHEEYGVYEDRKVLGAKVTSNCDYQVTIKLGSSRASEASLSLKSASPVTYEDHIQKILTSQCVACHGTWKDWTGVSGAKSEIVAAVESGSMPPSQALSDAEIATFLAWADTNFLQRNPNPVLVTPDEEKLKRVFYRNNNDDLLNGLELLGVTTKDLRRSLWIQEEGLEAQLKTRQLYTFPSAPQL